MCKVLFIFSTGHGMDCYRHYESILFGAIPIVQNSTLFPIFNDSPVYMLQNWTHVTKEQFMKFKLPTTSRKVLMMQHWFDKIDRALGRKSTVIYLSLIHI